MGSLYLLDFFKETFWIWLIGALSFVIYIKIKLKFNKRSYSKTKEMTKCESPIEEMLMEALVKKGHQVYSQEPCGAYRIDLSIYGKNRKVAIECDGEAYHSSREQLAHDRKKDFYLKKNKWIVLRFSGSEIYQNRDRCIQAVETHLMTKKDRKKIQQKNSRVGNKLA